MNPSLVILRKSKPMHASWEFTQILHTRLGADACLQPLLKAIPGWLPWREGLMLGEME